MSRLLDRVNAVWLEAEGFTSIPYQEQVVDLRQLSLFDPSDVDATHEWPYSEERSPPIGRLMGVIKLVTVNQFRFLDEVLEELNATRWKPRPARALLADKLLMHDAEGWLERKTTFHLAQALAEATSQARTDRARSRL